MNHSILVVICDFLVLSVLSLSLGVAPMNSSFTGQGTRIDDYTANILLDELKAKSIQLNKAREALLESQRKLGYAETRSKQVQKLNDELAQIRSRMNYLEAKLKKRKGEVGKLSREKLLARLEKESVRRLKVVTEMTEAKAALEFQKAKNKELAEKMNVLQQDMMRRDDELTEKKTLLDERTERLKKLSSKLQVAKSTLGNLKGDLEKTESALNETKGILKTRSEALDTTKTRLKNITVELEGTKTEAKAALMDLSYVRGRLSATEKELAESRSRLVKSQKNVAVNELELRDAQQKITSLQKMLKNAVGDLSETQQELNNSKKKAEMAARKLVQAKISLAETSSKEKATQNTLKKLKDSLSEAVQKLRSDALEKYSQAAVLLKMNVQEKRFLINYKKSIDFYLPEVAIANKRYLISSIDLLSGMGRVITSSSKINLLSYKIGKPKDKKMQEIKNPILSLNSDNRVCMVEVPSIRKESIELLTYGNLRKRGLQDLTLFKYTSFGQESSSLEGRCSLGLKKDDNYLYVRNSARRNAPLLKADIGDFVITKQGELVGIAVEIQSFDMGSKQRVKFFVFPDDFNIKDVSNIPVVKSAGSKYYSKFADSVAKINSRIKHLNRIKKADK